MIFLITKFARNFNCKILMVIYIQCAGRGIIDWHCEGGQCQIPRVYVLNIEGWLQSPKVVITFLFDFKIVLKV